LLVLINSVEIGNFIYILFILKFHNGRIVSDLF